MISNSSSLVVIQTHPTQYHAPLYRTIQQQFKIPVKVIYGSDFSVAGYQDKEFKTSFAWDTDLLTGYSSVFLSRVSDGGASVMEKVSTKGMERELAKANPKAILICGYTPFFHQMAFYLAWRKAVPLLFRAETTDHAVKRNALKSFIRDHTLSWFYRKYAKLLYIGQLSHKHFRHLGVPDKKLVFSPYCVDSTPFQCSDENRNVLRHKTRGGLGVKENEKILLFSGKLSPRKGPDLLLEAFKNLPSHIREGAVVVFMGDGELRKKLETLGTTHSSGKIRFLGFQNQTQLSRFYHAADLLIVPSRHSEVWGLVVNEGLHHGLPCVVSEAVGAAPDLIVPGETGEIAEADSAASLAQAIERAMRLVGQIEVRVKCRKKVEGYTIQKAAEGITRAYQSVTHESGK